MYLKSLEIQGFKSFPDKIKLDFDKGLTAVVGPNGSGKSNIGDAVRWVLGEQSSKTLRGGKMEDVIFSGTQYRKSVGFAAVTLNISNEDRALNCDSDLVGVTRKLYRNGDSEYLINGSQVRLKDIVELFMDTGLGKDGYSIIGQGRVADIVSSKSNERREIFEEAAGISKFRYKKVEAERRLAAAEDNILRLKDILGELEQRVEPLRVQSEKAQRFIILAEERKSLEISVWMNKTEELKKSLNWIEEKLLISNGEYEALTNELEELDKAIEKSYDDRQACNMRVEELREQIRQIELENSENIRMIAVLENDIKHIEDSIKGYEEQKLISQSSNEKILSDITQKEAELENLKNSKLDNQKMLADCENEFAGISVQSNELDEQTSDNSSEISKLYIKKSELVFTIENTRQTKIDTTTQITELNESMENCDTAVMQNESERKEALECIDAVEQQLFEHTNKYSGYSKLLERKEQALETLNRDFSAMDIELRELTQKRKLLADLENSMEGFSYSVKQIVKAGKSGQISGIYGSVAQLITADAKYSLAIETALGAQMQNIIVENEDTAKRGIRLLKEQNAGRATFLPITSVKSNYLNESNLDMQEGFVAIASELVEFDERFQKVISYLLGRTVIAEDIDCATALSKKYGYKFKVVTLDGQVVNAGGSFTGGSSSRSTGVLSRRNEINQIDSRLEGLQIKHAENKKQVGQITAEVAKLRYDVEGEKQFIADLNSDKIRAQSELERIKLISSQLEENEKQADERRKHLEDKIRSCDEQEQISIEQLNEIEKLISEKEKSIQDVQSKLTDYKNKREELSGRLSEIKLKNVELEKDCEACLLYIENQKQVLENLATDNTKYDGLIADCIGRIEAKRQEIEAVKQNSATADGRAQEIHSKINTVRYEGAAFEKQANDYRLQQKNKNDEKETASRELSRLGERKDAMMRDYDGIVSELWEQYQLSVTEAAELSQKIEDLVSATKRLNELKNKIRSLGSVNVAAIEEYKEVNERYTFMSAQLRDVEVSKAELEKLIDNLTENMKAVFSECFTKINTNFKTIFVELFGGGKAELSLTEPDNILESGIEINVAPPGKVIKSLSLLSGGEQAFVAIAIYFAILKIKPSPFCILDEIEAALDDVNVTKYAAYLRNFVSTTQFILITHRRGTMEEADVLYGVTMQEKGISKLLKLDVNDSLIAENII